MGIHPLSVILLFAFVTFASPSNQSLGVKEESTVFFHSASLKSSTTKSSVPFLKVCWYVVLATIDVEKIPIRNRLSIVKLNMLVLVLLLFDHIL